MSNIQKYRAKYKCLYCKHEFLKLVGFIDVSDHFSKRNKGGWSKVKCPKCENYLKTKEDSLLMEEIEKK